MSILPNSTIGIIGGGQLGKMLAESANRMGFRVVVLDPAAQAPAFTVAHESIVASFDDAVAIERLFAQSDVVTFEFENVNADLIKQFNQHYYNIPQGDWLLHITQNRIREKRALQEAGLPIGDFAEFNPLDETSLNLWLLDHKAYHAYPFVMKTQEGGYDGKGQVVVRDPTELINLTPLYGLPTILERFIHYDYEASMIAVRSTNGEFSSFPMARNIHVNNILHASIADNDFSEMISSKAKEMVEFFMIKHNIIGILAFEFFVVGDDIFVNELAPRPHNSGHYSIEGCYTNQFEQHIRAICGLPLGDTTLKQKVIMFNLLGQHIPALMNYLPNLSKNAHLHLYGKTEVKDNRKMGHITFIGDAGIERFKHDVFNE